MSVWHHAARTIAVVCLVSLLGLGADAAGAAGGSAAGVPAPPARVPVAVAHPMIDEPSPRQFEIIREIAGDALAITAPATDEVWVVFEVDGALHLGHFKGRTWSSTVLSGQVSEPAVGLGGDRSAVLDSTGPDDVWLVAQGRLSHYNGSRWQDVRLPRDPEGRALLATTVTAQAPGQAYVGVARGVYGEGGAVYRYVGGAWARLGAPPQGWPFAGMTPRDIKPVKGVVMVHWSRQTNRVGDSTFWWHDGRRWLYLYDGPRFDLRYWNRPTAWILRDDWRHLVLGYHTGAGMTFGTCMTWDAPGPVRECRTSAPVSAAELRRDGSVVAASDGYFGWDESEDRFAPPALYLRYPSGREVRVGQTGTWYAPRPYPRSVVAVAPDGMTTWAATPLGLQRLSGRR